MSFGKKLSTLIKATLRGGLSVKSRQHRKSSDPETQLKAVRDALAEVERKEREVAEQLNATQVRLRAASENGDWAEEKAQQQIAARLEAHLQTQSTKASQLATQLAAVESVADNQQAAEKQSPDNPHPKLSNQQPHSETTSQANATDEKLGETAEPNLSSSSASSKNASSLEEDSDKDLEARKSRLSG